MDKTTINLGAEHFSLSALELMLQMLNEFGECRIVGHPIGGNAGIFQLAADLTAASKLTEDELRRCLNF